MLAPKGAGLASAVTDGKARKVVGDDVRDGRSSKPHSKNVQAVAGRGLNGGARQRRKGDRIERELVARHKALGVHAERYPLNGASRFRGSGHDIDVYLFSRDDAPLVCEVKGRKSGAGFATLERWLAEYDALFLRPQQFGSRCCRALAHMHAHSRSGAAMSDSLSEAVAYLQLRLARGNSVGDRLRTVWAGVVAARDLAAVDVVDNSGTTPTPT